MYVYLDRIDTPKNSFRVTYTKYYFSAVPKKPTPVQITLWDSTTPYSEITTLSANQIYQIKRFGLPDMLKMYYWGVYSDKDHV